MVLFWGVIAALPALIHARLHGCAGSSCPEQNHSANPNYMLIVNHLDDSGPDRISIRGQKAWSRLSVTGLTASY